jgi:hypothetical protein
MSVKMGSAGSVGLVGIAAKAAAQIKRRVVFTFIRSTTVESWIKPPQLSGDYARKSHRWLFCRCSGFADQTREANPTDWI